MLAAQIIRDNINFNSELCNTTILMMMTINKINTKKFSTVNKHRTMHNVSVGINCVPQIIV